MKILHIFDHSVPLHSGYTFRSRSILREQQRRGWQTVHLTTPRHIRPGPSPETVEDLLFHRTPPPPEWTGKLPILRELAEINATAQALDALVRAEQPDILHAHSPVLTALAALKVARAHGRPLVYEIRAFWEDAAAAHGTCRPGDLRYRTTKGLESWVARRADAVGGICQGLLTDLRARGIAESKLFLTPNAVDLEQFSGACPRDTALAATLGLNDADVIGFIGSFYDYEGLDVLIAAMPDLLARRPNIALLLVGGGPEEKRLKAQAAASPAAARIHFTGRVPHHEVERYYSLVDILCYPRKKMRLTDLVTPLKPLEAMAEGKLVTASDVGGHRELITDGETGSLFTADSPEALAACVATLFERRDLWDARRAAGRAYVARERSWSRTVDHYEPVYQRLLAKKQ